MKLRLVRVVVKRTDPKCRLRRIKCQPWNPGHMIESRLRFLCLQNGNDDIAYLWRLSSTLNGLIPIRGTEPCLAVSAT